MQQNLELQAPTIAYHCAMVGTLINVATVGVGSLLGMGLKSKLPERFIEIVFQVMGLFTLLLGILMALETGDPLILLMGTLIGAVVGEALQLEKRSTQLVEKLGASKSPDDAKQFAHGLMTAFMLFCVGALTVVGCFNEGIEGDNKLIITKSIMDFFSSMALASAFGKGVLFSVIPLLLYQGGLTLLAGVIQPWLSEAMITEMTASGGLMMIGLGVTILKIKTLRVLNMLPGLLAVVLLVYFAEWMGWYALL